MENPVKQFSELTGPELDALRATSDARAVKEGRDLLKDVKCVWKETEESEITK